MPATYSLHLSLCVCLLLRTNVACSRLLERPLVPTSVMRNYCTAPRPSSFRLMTFTIVAHKALDSSYIIYIYIYRQTCPP